MSKSPIVVPLLPRPRDTTALSVGHIYLNVQIFPLLYCVTSLDKQQTVEKCLSTQERWVPQRARVMEPHAGAFPNLRMCVTNKSQMM